MITAKEARALTIQSAKSLAVQKYEPAIREAAEAGCTSIYYNHKIPDLEADALRELGYDVGERNFDNSYTISW